MKLLSSLKERAETLNRNQLLLITTLIEKMAMSLYGVANIAKIAERCRKHILKVDGNKDGVSLTIDRKAFRGLVYAFRTAR